MKRERLIELLEGFENLNVGVIGDFGLDVYYHLEENGEISRETGKQVYQIYDRKSSPGSAGTIVNNLRSLGIKASCFGYYGDDGFGYEMLNGLRDVGADVKNMIEINNYNTLTYIKQFLDGKEYYRQDIKNKGKIDEKIEEELYMRLNRKVRNLDGVVVCDEVPRKDNGTISEKMGDVLSKMSYRLNEYFIDTPFLVDSREKLTSFRRMYSKLNIYELKSAIGEKCLLEDDFSLEELQSDTLKLSTLIKAEGYPIFVTLGKKGMLCMESKTNRNVQGQRDGLKDLDFFHVRGLPIKVKDIVGAGSSANAGIIGGLGSKSNLKEAVELGVLVSSITVGKEGTGTVNREEVLNQYDKYKEYFK
jgi:D-glycero-beta-D-manno-heptose-7-phosphate kinase